MAMHAMEHSETGFTPNQLMLGREVLMPEDIIMGSKKTQEQYNPPEWVKTQSEVLPEVYHLVRDNLKTTLLRRKKDYDTRVYEKTFEVGDLVYKLGITRKTGAQALMPVWKGPFLVVESNPPTYQLKDHRSKLQRVHHDRLKRCQDRNIPIWIKRQQYLLLASNAEQDDGPPSLGEQEDHSTQGERQLLEQESENAPVEACQQDQAERHQVEKEASDETLVQEEEQNVISEEQQNEVEETEVNTEQVKSQVEDNTESDIEDEVGPEEWLEGGVLQRLFKPPPKSHKLVLTMDHQRKLPSQKGRDIKVPSHLRDFVAK